MTESSDSNASDAKEINTSDKLEFKVGMDLAGLRLDQALARLLPDYSRSRLQSWIEQGQVTLDGATVAVKHKVWGDEIILVQPQSLPAEQVHQAEDIALNVVYEDDSIIVINKPAGMVVHPGNGNWEGTMLNALLHHSPQLQGVPRAGIVHRLDKDTSGLLVVAKTLQSQTSLVRQLQRGTERLNAMREEDDEDTDYYDDGDDEFAEEEEVDTERLVKREYLALVWGKVARAGKVDAPIGRHPSQRVKMAVVESGKQAITHYTVEEAFPSCTLLRCRLETGRTHQIRVHMAHAGHPLVGDSTYQKGPQKCLHELRGLLNAFPRQALHATRLALEHPQRGERMEWSVLMPSDMQMLLSDLRKAVNELD